MAKLPEWAEAHLSSTKPKGILDGRTNLTKRLAQNADQIVDIVVEQALGGNLSAAALVLSRVAPPIKSQLEKVQFKLDTKAPISEQVQDIIQGVADGKISADTAQSVINSIAAAAQIRQFDELEQRIRVLESM